MIIESYVHATRQKNIKINLQNNFMKDVSNYVPKMVITDKVRFRQCCSALIQNAIDNTQAGDINIAVKYDAYKQMVEFEVEDFAKGMDNKDKY